MKSWLRDIGRSFRGGVDRAYGKAESEILLDLLTERLADKSISDEVIVHQVIIFLRKFPDKRNTNNFQALLERIMNERPGSIEILKKRLGL